jgi:uncharacterized protein YjeT (DUF2065 family)
VIEGLFYALMPSRMKTAIAAMLTVSDDKLRVMGTVAVALGVAVVWLAKQFAGG